MPITSRADDGTHGGAVGEGAAGPSEAPATGPGADGTPAGGQPRRAFWRSPTALWRSPTGLVILGATVAGLVVRFVLLTRPDFLTSGTVEYDDGVYLGAAIRLLEGTLPYKDFAFVQPPGILIIALPFAFVAKVASTAAGLAAARIVTVCASAACVPLAGRLVRPKGALVTLVTCGVLAVYPADVLTARTLLLEPWMNLLCLLAVNVAFSPGGPVQPTGAAGASRAVGRLASPKRVAWAGVILGFATTVKFWAAAPAAALLVVCLLTRENRVRRTRSYVIALVAGFVVPIAPFAAAGPRALLHSTVFDQVTRMGAYAPFTERLAYLTGTMIFIDKHGTLNFNPRGGSMLALGSNGTMVTSGIGLVPVAVAVIAVALIAVAYLRRPVSRSPLEWFALAVFVTASVAVSTYSAFFYHYPAFPAPWLAIALGTAAGAAAGAYGRSRFAYGRGGVAYGRSGAAGRTARRIAVGVTALAVLAVTALETGQLAAESAPASPAAVRNIVPRGACVFTDQVSFTIAADRFPSSGNCPDVLDSLAATLVLSNGVSVPGGAGQIPRVRSGWEATLAKAQYVWLSPGFQARIPWTSGLRTWFDSHFRLIRTFRSYGDSKLYERR